MKMVKIAIIISCMLTVLTCSAKKYQIKVLNTPTITIDKKEAKVGDWFDDESVIVWSKDNQAMRVVSEDNKVYTLSAKLYKEAKAKKFIDFIIYTKPLAARGTKDLDLIEQLAERFDQDFIMLDEIVIDLSGSDINNEDSFVFEPLDVIWENQPIIKITPYKKCLRIRRDIISNGDSNHQTIITMRVTYNPVLGDSMVISNNFEIEVLPTIIF